MDRYQTRGYGFFFNVIMSFENDQSSTSRIVRVVVSPIYHSLACGNVCYNPCLRATMELFSDYRYSPFIAFNLVVSLRMFISPKPCTTFE